MQLDPAKRSISTSLSMQAPAHMHAHTHTRVQMHTPTAPLLQYLATGTRPWVTCRAALTGKVAQGSGGSLAQEGLGGLEGVHQQGQVSGCRHRLGGEEHQHLGVQHPLQLRRHGCARGQP